MRRKRTSRTESQDGQQNVRSKHREKSVHVQLEKRRKGITMSSGTALAAARKKQVVPLGKSETTAKEQMGWRRALRFVARQHGTVLPETYLDLG
jgi:hypothetical protein